MEKELLYVFGTGNAAVTRCYNTCFAIQAVNGGYFMVDTGGGNGILGILESMDVPLSKIHHIFITHEHTDHILGIVWMIRMIATAMKKGSYEGDLNIYCHDELPETISTICRLTMQEKFYSMIGGRIRLIPVKDQETLEILGLNITFFDILSTKARQFGFTAILSDGSKLCCAGDEPLNPRCESYALGSGWLLHEAFCLYGDREKYKPYEKHHSTVKEACELAERLRIPSLILWHTEDKTIKERRELYTKEGAAYYHGNLFVPDDRTVIEL